MTTTSPEPKNTVWGKLPSIIIALAGAGLVYALWNPSANPDVYIFSYFRATAIALCLGTTLYALLSLRVRGLQDVNNMMFYTVVVGLAFSEIALRMSPSLIPDGYLSLLPFEAGQEIAGQRGLFTPSNVIGKGTMFHMKPGIRLPDKPWVTIDKNGFYNNVPLGKQIDAVLLGASVMDARDAKKNVADMFYEADSSAYSLAQGGPYGPYQYRDAYKKIIIEPKVEHRYVVVLLILPNEFNKIHQYERVLASGGDYRDLFQASLTPDILPAAMTPWTISIAMKLSAQLPSMIEKFNRTAKEEYAIAKFRDRTLKIPASLLGVPKTTERWPSLGTALDGIFEAATSQGARPLVIYYPLPAILSIPYIEGHDEERTKLAKYYEATVSRLAGLVRGLGGEFLDVTPAIRARQFEQDIMVRAGEYHLNQRGVKFLYSLIRERLDKMDLKGN